MDEGSLLAPTCGWGAEPLTSARHPQVFENSSTRSCALKTRSPWLGTGRKPQHWQLERSALPST